MTETVNCPVCGSEVPVELENLEGDPIEVDCECGASLRVAYTVAEIDTDVTVETARFKCPKCGGEVEVEGPDENGSKEFACDICPTRFKVEWSDWGHFDKYEVLTENCPHCGETLDYSPEIGYRMARLKHLLDHALYAATDLNLEDFPDIPFWDIASSVGEDSWQNIAMTARGQLFGLIDSLGPMTKKERGGYERKAIAWLKSKYRPAFLRRRY